jgi:hypothetical protein
VFFDFFDAPAEIVDLFRDSAQVLVLLVERVETLVDGREF